MRLLRNLYKRISRDCDNLKKISALATLAANSFNSCYKWQIIILWAASLQGVCSLQFLEFTIIGTSWFVFRNTPTLLQSPSWRPPPRMPPMWSRPSWRWQPRLRTGWDPRRRRTEREKRLQSRQQRYSRSRVAGAAKPGQSNMYTTLLNNHSIVSRQIESFMEIRTAFLAPILLWISKERGHLSIWWKSLVELWNWPFLRRRDARVIYYGNHYDLLKQVRSLTVTNLIFHLQWVFHWQLSQLQPSSPFPPPLLWRHRPGTMTSQTTTDSNRDSVIC